MSTSTPVPGRQGTFFCTCGRDLPWARELCRACYRAAVRSRQRSASLRDEILTRAGCRCQACGAGGRLHVHHRKPGINDRGLLITVYAEPRGHPHARRHRLAALRFWLPELLVALWIEQHPGRPLQRQFPVAA